MKKIIILILSLLAFWENGCAKTFVGGDVIDGIFIVKVDRNNNWEYKKGQFIIEDDTRDFVYCLEPFVKVKKGEIYYEVNNDFSYNLNISEEVWKRVNLLSYYGYMYQEGNINHSDPKWYYITQLLIWREVDPAADFWFTDSFESDINYNLFLNEIYEMYALVNNHYQVPEFSIPEFVWKGENIELKDNNQVLNSFEVLMGDVFISDNTININCGYDEINFSLKKKRKKSNFIVYASNNSQNILKGSNVDEVSSDYKIYVKEKRGDIKVTKRGEVSVYEWQMSKALEGVEITLYDEQKKEIVRKRSNEEGIVIFDSLEVGKYYVRETEALDGYVLDATYYELNVTFNKEDNIVKGDNLLLYNEIVKGELVIQKLDEDTKEPLEGVGFWINDSDDNLVYEGLTNKEGIINLELPKGVYFIKEIKTLEGYVMKDYQERIEVKENNQIINVIVKNKKEEPEIPKEPEEEPKLPYVIVEIPNTGLEYNNQFILIIKRRFV